MRELLKWGLIGGGAFFLLKDKLFAATEQPAVAPPTPAPAILPAPAVTTPAPPVYVPPAPNPQAVNTLPVTDELIKKASWDAATAGILGNRVLLNVHEWNWYREHSGGGRTNPGSDLYHVGGDPNVRITANEYLARLQAAGLGRVRSRRAYYA